MGHKYKITTNTQTTNKIHSSVISRRMLYYNSTNVYMSSQAENFTGLNQQVLGHNLGQKRSCVLDLPLILSCQFDIAHMNTALYSG